MAVTLRAFVILSLISISIYYAHAESVETWGDCKHYLLLGREHVFKKARRDITRTRVIKFPPVRKSQFFIIHFFKLFYSIQFTFRDLIHQTL